MTKSNKAAVARVVVGIGASAGGVEAISAFLDHERGESSAAFVVVMHLAATRTSHLTEILMRHTSMPVVLVEDGIPVEPERVYVIPPGMILTVADDAFHLSAISLTERVPTVIDRLFNSMAEHYGERAIGVVLSGTGSDGAMGLKAIKDRGGLTIAQSEHGSAPLFSGMPQSAIAAGAIDVQLPVEDIAVRLASAIATMTRDDEEYSGSGAEKHETLRKEICALLRERVGHDFSGYKPSTFFRRVQRRMYVLQLSDMDAYVTCLQQTPGEMSLLFRDLLISVTSFFRDEASFQVLEKEVIPALFRGKRAGEEVRVWVPGCATGEEAYSLGILLLEYTERMITDAPSIRLFATDIDERALGIARRGRYPSALMDAVTPERRRQFFLEDRGHFTVQKRLRDVCTFSPHNALRDPPFSRIDLVSCRNLLIYLGQEFQDRVMPILHYALRPDGFLFVGMAEGATRHRGMFAPISNAHRIFRKLPSPPGNVSLPLLNRDGGRADTHPAIGSKTTTSNNAMRRQIETHILQSHAPPYVLVSSQGDALFYSHRTGNYLEFSPGAPSRHLMSNARKELRLGLRRALHEAVSTQERVTLPEVNLPGEDGMRRVQVSIEPFQDGETPLYLVLFHDRGAALKEPDNLDTAGAQTVQQLESELRETREALQSTYEEFETAIEELRVANEELMSVNEELQSSNEEMETSKEELQSVNEEMQTVNHEMSRHVEALDQSNADLHGLLESTGIATIFLDQRLAIRRYTQIATDIFTLIPSDCGRLITDLAHQLEPLDLRGQLEQTLIRRESTQLSVARKDHDRHYLLTLTPYTGTGKETLGVVMTFVDVTALIKADTRHKTMIGELNHRVRNMLAVVSAMAQQTLSPVVPAEPLDAFLGRLLAMARTYKLLTETGWSHMMLAELIHEELTVVVGSNRFEIAGPPVRLDPREALALGMVVHELATNALKYGALSNENGRVEVRWDIAKGDDDALVIGWSEKGGPAVVQSNHRGFGTLLISRQLSYELRAESTIDFAPDGLMVSMRLPRLAQSGSTTHE